MHETLLWEKENDDVEAFKEDFIFSDIIQTEVETKSMMEWLGVLPIHTFQPRHFESDQPRSPLGKALRMTLAKESTNGEEEAACVKEVDDGGENGVECCEQIKS